MNQRRARDLAALQDPALARLQAALTADASPEELIGEPAALSFYSAASWSGTRSWHRPAMLATKLGAATAACLVGLSGVAAAAYTGSLPDTLQNIAHETIKAPAAHPPVQAVGPDASGQAAYGLCQAFAKDKQDAANAQNKAAEQAAEGSSPKAVPPGQAKKQANANGNANSHGNSQAAGDRGQSKQRSVAYRNLVRAAGGEDKVDAYCASVPKPSETPEPIDSGKPTAKPTHAVTGKPTTKPTQAATGKPSELPAPAQSHPTGSPSPLPRP